MEVVMSKNLSTVVDSCVERVKEGLERALARAMEWTLHQTEEDAVSELGRAELVFLMAVSALSHLDAEVSGMLLKEIERWSIFPRIKKYMSGKMDAEWEVPREMINRASKFAHVLEVGGLFSVPPELRDYLAELLAEDEGHHAGAVNNSQEGAAGGSGDASLHDQSKRPRKDPRGPQQVEESSAGGKASAVDPQQERRYQMATRRRRSRKQGGRGQENKVNQVPTPPVKSVAKQEPSKIQTSAYLPQTDKPTGAIPKVRPPAKTKPPKTVPSPPTEASPRVRKERSRSPAEVDITAADISPRVCQIMSKAVQTEEPQASAAQEMSSSAVQTQEPQATAALEMSSSAVQTQEPQATAAPEVTPAAVQPPPPQPRMSRLAARRQLWEGVEKDGGQLVEGAVLSGADLNEARADKGYRTPLALAASEGRVGAVRALVRLCAQLEVGTGKEKRTALHLASAGGHMAVVRELLAAGADVGAEDRSQFTPLHLASGEGHLDVVRELLAAGANLQAEDINKFTPLYWASQEGHAAVVLELLEAGANVGAVDCDGDTPLHWASLNGHLATVRLLVEDGAADFNTRDSYGGTPLYWADYNRHTAVAEYLRSVGATK